MNFLCWFVATGWLYLIGIIGIVLGIVLVKNWCKYDWFERLGVIAILVLILHVYEEWVLPGGFHYIYNLDSSSPSNFPMNQLTDMITNLGGVLLGVAVLAFWKFGKGSGIAIGLFSLFEAVIHIILAGKSLNAFSDIGQVAFYAPGLNTALFGFLPVFVAYLIVFIKDRPNWKQILGGLGSLLLLSFLFVNLPELIFKDENSIFAFANHGYYDQFLNGTAQVGLTGGTIASIIIAGLIIIGLITFCIVYFGVKKKKLSDLKAYLDEKLK